MLPFVVIWREVFMNDGDMHLARSSHEQFSPGPYRQIVEPLNLQNFYSLDTPRGYLIGSDDIALPPGEWGWHPRMSSRLGLYRLVQMPGSHELIFQIRPVWPTRLSKPDATNTHPQPRPRQPNPIERTAPLHAG
jgi:hypothetical protein